MAKISLFSNMEEIGAMVGTIEGILDGIEEPRYMEGVIKEAHKNVTADFDRDAASAGAAGFLAHMYEFGTRGITRGPIKYGPTDDAAKLWVHLVAGKGGNQNFTFAYRPALNRNPQPTTESTGVASKYLRKLSKRKYVFENKAFVMETGQTVEIKAKNSSMLFVPFRGEAPRNPLNTKGFVWWPASKGPITTTPGRQTKGNFTRFWLNWWSGVGSALVEQDMKRTIEFDFNHAHKTMLKFPKTMKPVSAIDIKGREYRNRKSATATFRVTTERRRT